MKSLNDSVKIAIAEYPLVQRSAVHGLIELSDTANRLAPTEKPKLALSTLSLHSRTTRHKTTFDVVILPPCLSENPPSLQDATPALNWLKRCHQDGAIICSVCSGTFLLAETGLLDGRSATTHWIYADTFKEKFPLIDLQYDRLIDTHQDLVTAGGLMAWTDLGLQLIERFQSYQTMMDVSHLFLLEPGTRQQKQYALFEPKLDHGDEKILTVQKLIKKDITQRFSVYGLAKQVGLTERTFLRRFQRATKLNPTQYIQQTRVALARRELETSNRSIDQVAYIVGYNDTPAFSRLFKKLVGLPPGIYRKRFTSTN